MCNCHKEETITGMMENTQGIVEILKLQQKEIETLEERVTKLQDICLLLSERVRA